MSSERDDRSGEVCHVGVREESEFLGDGFQPANSQHVSVLCALCVAAAVVHRYTDTSAYTQALEESLRSKRSDWKGLLS